MKSLKTYWSNVRPSYRFLKEELQAISRNAIESLIDTKIARENLDSLMLKDSSEFLRLSIINLLGYKHLVCGKYLAWGRVTIYYSQFYIVNCLLRLKGFALVHLDFLDENPLTLRIDRVRDNRSYRMHKCSASGHQIVWKRFSELYPNLSNEDMGKFSVKERVDWNYDLRYASQTTSKFALEEAEDRCRYNFLDPNYGISSTAEEGEYYENLMASFGYEEGGTGDYQKYAIDCLVNVGTGSKYRNWYCSLFESMLQDIASVGSPNEMKNEIIGWLKNALFQLKQ